MTKEEVWAILEDIPDPEIPVISIVDLGIARNVSIVGNSVKIEITPTYSGCPAMDAIEKDIKLKLKEAGVENIEVKLVYSPAWTTDWINDEAKEKLRAYGIAPPEKVSTSKLSLTGKSKTIQCPRCGSEQTILVSHFGSTACKSLYKCESCLESFDYFKCH